jgi:hypothetical protein
MHDKISHLIKVLNISCPGEWRNEENRQGTKL